MQRIVFRPLVPGQVDFRQLDLYRVVGYDRESGQEVRTHSHRLVLPLTAISELSTVLQQFEAAVNKMRAEQQKPQEDAGSAG